MANGTLNPDFAVSLGPFIQSAHDQFSANPAQLNPSTILNLPTGYELIRTIQMSDLILPPAGTPRFYGYLARGGQPDQQVIALRGTANPLEWWDNLQFLPVPFAHVSNVGNVADGFYDIYQTLTTMDPADPNAAPNGLPAYVDSTVPLIITGHSLGAALVTLLAADLAVNTSLRPQVWTFASPKVGDANFAAMYGYHSTVSWRIYNIPDLVPRVPIDPLDEYQHVNAGYAINSIGMARRSVGCLHDLNTYLHVLSNGNVPLNPGCKL